MAVFINEQLRGPLRKVWRAKQHIASLKHEIENFFDTDPYQISVGRDGERRPVYYIHSALPTPDHLPLLAGDAIQNLRAALDHLAYEIVCSETQTPTSQQPASVKAIYFPIAEDKAKYDKIKFARLPAVSKEIVDVFDSLKPYSGGNDDLWRLHQLSVIEKHRLLLTVGAQAAGIHLGEMLFPSLKEFFPAWASEAFRNMDEYIMPADKGFPLVPGFKLYSGLPDEQPNTSAKFRFDVAINEPGVVTSASLVGTLQNFVDVVEHALARLAPSIKPRP